MSDFTNVAYEDLPQEVKDNLTEEEYNQIQEMGKAAREAVQYHG